MLFHKFKGTATLAGGNWSKNTEKFSMGMLRQIVIEPTTATNIYDLSIVDEDGFTVFPTDEENTIPLEGAYSQSNLNIPLRGFYTVRIQNSTVAADTVKYLLVVQEEA